MTQPAPTDPTPLAPGPVPTYTPPVAFATPATSTVPTFTPQPVVAPVPTPPPAPQPTPTAAVDPAAPSGPGITFPAGTAWRDMTGEQQVAYWQHQAKRHEARAAQVGDYEQAKADQQRYQELLTQTQTDTEKAIAAARREGETTATARANEALVEAYFRAASAARQVGDDDVTELLDQLDRRKFINASGQVDTGRIYGLVNKLAAPIQQAPPPVAAPTTPVAPAGWPAQQPPPGWPQQQAPQQWQVPAAPAAVMAPPGSAPVAPAPGQQPDMGQGQFSQAGPSGLEAGKAAARARFGAPKTATPA